MHKNITNSICKNVIKFSIFRSIILTTYRLIIEVLYSIFKNEILIMIDSNRLLEIRYSLILR